MAYGAPMTTANRPRSIPTFTSYPFRNLPLTLVMAYLLTVFAMFLAWPINWPLYGGWVWARLIAYVAVCFGALTFGCRRGSAPDKSKRELVPFAATNTTILFGATSAIALLFPASYIYTGRWPWQVLSALEDQGEAYRALYDQLMETTGQRAPIAIARAMAAPLTFAVLPLGILNWKKLSAFLRILVVATGFCSVIFSTLRGTDREFADLFIVSGAVFLVTIGRQGVASGQVLALVKKYWAPTVLLGLFIWIAAGMYTDRKTARLGGYDNRLEVCANDSQICANMDAPAIAWMPIEQRFGTSIFVLSASSGFYGLALGLEKEFEPSWGVGHSPAALSIYELVTGDQSLHFRTYTYRNGYDSWSDENYWSTLILWIANDTGFAGAVVALVFIGFLWGRVWRDATQRLSDPAAVLFSMMMITMVYLPANNQVFASYDGYTVFSVWLLIWLRQRRTIGRSQLVVR